MVKRSLVYKFLECMMIYSKSQMYFIFWAFVYLRFNRRIDIPDDVSSSLLLNAKLYLFTKIKGQASLLPFLVIDCLGFDLEALL